MKKKYLIFLVSLLNMYTELETCRNIFRYLDPCVWKEFVYATYVFELFVKTKGIALSKCQAMRGICLRKESKAH